MDTKKEYKKLSKNDLDILNKRIKNEKQHRLIAAMICIPCAFAGEYMPTKAYISINRNPESALFATLILFPIFLFFFHKSIF